MRSAVLARLERLEARPEVRKPLVRYGRLHALRDDYTGERHIVVVKREPTESSNAEWCEFEERPGPPPPGSDDGVPRLYFTEDEMKI